MKFKAAILENLNSPLIIKDVTTTKLQVGQVLVKILMSGLCGSQIHEITGAKGNKKYLPHMMGHEGCGHVIDVGPGVTNVKIADKVVMHWRIGKGIESDYPKYMLDDKEITSGKVTTLSEYSVCSENRLTSVLETTDDRLCCLLGCSLTTAFGVIDNDANLKLGETVLILGAGGVGLNLIQAAKLKGAGMISVVEKNKNKINLIKELGGTTDILDFCSYDVIIDTTGDTNTISHWLNSLASGGRFILIGQGGSDFDINIKNVMNLFYGDGKKIIASQGGQTNPSKDIPRYIQYFNKISFNIDSLITHTYDLYDINKGFETLRSGNAGRIMIKI